MSEEAVLIRALRDFNVPKIITTDMPVLLGLINELFPSIDAPRKRNLKSEEVIRQCVLKERLQGEVQIVRKAVELEELLNVRHSVFIVGSRFRKGRNLASIDQSIWRTTEEHAIILFWIPKQLQIITFMDF
ncbi:MAG: hypothetical protein Ta2E_12490 [Mycoplasmoidaceae bacterium]|nr:MAG: hypothetical protein Ta2E_12490 [Mycoplasmoidaceae bacterium]